MLIQILTEARIIERRVGDGYGFKEKYIYCYFVARYIADNLYDAEYEKDLRSRLQHMVTHAHVQDFFSILIFVVYRRKDEKLFRTIIETSQQLYQDVKPFDFDRDVTFLAQLSGRPVELALPDTDATERKDAYRQQLDEIAEEELKEEITEDTEHADEQHRKILELNRAAKTVELLGQVLRNFPGSLRGDKKSELANEAYLLGLRSAKVVTSLIEDNIETFRTFLTLALNQHFSEMPPKRVQELADAFVAEFTRNNGIFFAKQISYSVGSEHLKETFRSLRSDICPISFSLINLSIKMDHGKTFPIADVELVNKALKNKVYASDVLRGMVYRHLYLFEEPRGVRQRACQIVGIKENSVALLTTDNKK